MARSACIDYEAFGEWVLAAATVPAGAKAVQFERLGDRAFVAQSDPDGLAIYDASAFPTLVPLDFVPLLLGRGHRVDSLWYGTEDGVLRIADLSDADRPVVIGQLDTRGVGVRHDAIEVVGDRVYSLDALHFNVVDVSDPTRPELLSTQAAAGLYVDLDVHDGRAMVIDRSNRVFVYDLADDATPTLERSVDLRDRLGTQRGVLTVRNGLAYLLRGATGDDGDYSFEIADLRDPRGVVSLGSVGLDEWASSVRVLGDVAALTSGHDLLLVDVSVPARPSKLTTIENARSVLDVRIVDGRAVVLTQGLVEVHDLSRRSTLPVRRALELDGVVPTPAAIQGRTAAVLADGGLRMLDLDAPVSRQLLSSVPIAGILSDVEFVHDRVLVTHYDPADSWRGALRVYDVSDPRSPQPLAAFEVGTPSAQQPGYATAVAVRDDRAVFVWADNRNSNLEVIDLASRPPRRIASIRMSSSQETAFEVEFDEAGEFAYVLAYDQLLRIFDLRDPERPRLASQVQFAAYPSDVVVADGYAYLSMQDQRSEPGLVVLDVRNPAFPLRVTGVSVVVDGESEVALDADRRLYVGGGRIGQITVLDVAAPSTPAFVARVRTVTSDVRGLTIDGDRLYAVSGKDRFVYEYGAHCDRGGIDPHIVTGPRRIPSRPVPNPFNPTTDIEFELEESVVVSIRIFDATGRRIRTLASTGPLDAGARALTWDGSDDAGARVASGVYYYRLEAGRGSSQGKIALVR